MWVYLSLSLMWLYVDSCCLSHHQFFVQSFVCCDIFFFLSILSYSCFLSLVFLFFWVVNGLRLRLYLSSSYIHVNRKKWNAEELVSTDLIWRAVTAIIAFSCLGFRWLNKIIWQKMKEEEDEKKWQLIHWSFIYFSSSSLLNFFVMTLIVNWRNR